MTSPDLSKLPNLQRRIDDGWKLQIETHRPTGYIHARIWRSDIGNSHNYIGETEAKALEGLETYVQSPEAARWDEHHGCSSGRRSGEL